jgi:gas vesicle protein
MNEELKVIIKAEVDKLKKGVQDSKKQIQDFKDKVKEASGDCDKNFKKLGDGISKGVKTAITGAIASITALGVALVGSVSATEEYRTAMGKLNTAFESAGSNAEVAKNTYNDLYRVLGDSDVAVEASNHLAKLTTEEKALSEYTNICQGVYATFGDSLPIEGLTEAINHTSKLGETQGVLADALEWSGITTDEFNNQLAKCNSEAQREKLIRETLSKLYDDASAKYEKNNKGLLAQRDAQAQLQENLAILGETMQPVVTLFTQFANDALVKITPHLQSFAENYLPIIKEVLDGIVVGLEKAYNFVSQYYPILIGIATVIGIITTAIGLYNVVSAVKTAMDVAQVTTVGALVSAYLAQAAAMAVALAPYVLIVAAITAVIAIIVLLVKNWDKVKETTVKVAKTIKDKILDMVESVKKWFTNMKDKIVEIVSNILSWVKSNWQGIALLFVNPLAGAFKLAYDNCEGFRNIVNNFIAKVKSAISTGFSALKTYIVNPIKNAVSNARDALGNLVTAFKDKLNTAKTTVKNAIDKIKGFFKFKWSLPKLKLPRISISGKFSIDPPSVPKFSIKWNKLGGVFDKPTLFSHGNSLQGLGEDGAEAVVPLEKNTQWLGKLAKMLNDEMGGGTPIILQVDGKTFAQISVDSINALTKQKGKLDLQLV